MSYKTILVYLPKPDGVTDVMALVLPMAESFDAHLMGLHVHTGQPLAGTIGAQVPPEIIEQYFEYMREDAKKIEASFAKAVKGAATPTEWRGEEKVSVDGDILSTISGQMRCADLVVMGYADTDHKMAELTADIILSAGRPVLLLPAAVKSVDFSGNAVIGWDGSREAARAVFDALPLLKRAKTTFVVTVGKGEDAKEAVRSGGGDMAEMLVRHGVKAELAMVSKGDSSAGEALMAYVSDKDADLLVMGCYSHSRLRERLFGGATRYVLEQINVPVLMSH